MRAPALPVRGIGAVADMRAARAAVLLRGVPNEFVYVIALPFFFDGGELPSFDTL